MTFTILCIHNYTHFLYPASIRKPTHHLGVLKLRHVEKIISDTIEI